MRHFKSVFNDEKPSMITKYFISQVSLIQTLSPTSYSKIFSYCFTKGTFNYLNFDWIPMLNDLVLKAIQHVDATAEQDNISTESIRIQMYEFHFSSVLLKLLKIPFLPNSYVLLFFERMIRKRDLKGNNRSSMPGIVPGIIRRVNQFFLLLYGEKVWIPFSQFLDSDFLKQFKGQIKKELSEGKDGEDKQQEKIIVPVKSPLNG